ncbi:hypothetical protein SLEP1_g49839 [Rubroshorea leprosula]|uniref:Bifunctional inhibitor/plant lipid transfer protein/seed storage helical domain-containing protein n=1 Tax=Rubroshorea leprosula TaxID=152421 RepID=A0AAV5M1D5_9ROSI|nr:hypothetical protein SLEP1_g49839 [Rubroshorea leprosula]
MAFSAFSLPISRIFLILAVVLTVSIFQVSGQLNFPCTPSMLTSVTPCMNFLTNSSSNGTTPTADCCNSLKSLTSGGMGCLCLIVTGTVPFQVPINRTLAISLPRSCNMPNVPVQCKANIAPVPAPDPISLSPVGSPAAPVVPEPTPSAEPTPPAEAPVSDTTPVLTPPSTEGSAVPTATTGSRPTLTPSAAVSSYSLSPSLLLAAVGFVVLKYYY